MIRPPHPALRGLWRDAASAAALARATDRFDMEVAPLMADALAPLAAPADVADLLGPPAGDAALDAALQRLRAGVSSTAGPEAPAAAFTIVTPPSPRPAQRRIAAARANPMGANVAPPPAAGAQKAITVPAGILHTAAHRVVTGAALPSADQAALAQLFAFPPPDPAGGRPREAAGTASTGQTDGQTESPRAAQSVPKRGRRGSPDTLTFDDLVPEARRRSSMPAASLATPPGFVDDPPRLAPVTGFRGLAARLARQEAAMGQHAGHPAAALDDAQDANPPRTVTRQQPIVAARDLGTPTLATPHPAAPPPGQPTEWDITDMLARILRQEARRQGIRIGEPP